MYYCAEMLIEFAFEGIITGLLNFDNFNLYETFDMIKIFNSLSALHSLYQLLPIW